LRKGRDKQKVKKTGLGIYKINFGWSEKLDLANSEYKDLVFKASNAIFVKKGHGLQWNSQSVSVSKVNIVQQ